VRPYRGHRQSRVLRALDLRETQKQQRALTPFSSQECPRFGHVARESCRRKCAALAIRRRAQPAPTSELPPAEEAGRRAERSVGTHGENGWHSGGTSKISTGDSQKCVARPQDRTRASTDRALRCRSCL